MIKSFADMARDVAGSLRGLVGNIKSGDWLGALQSVLDIVGQVAGIIKGTGPPAVRTFSLAGARAAGGSVMPNGKYRIGRAAWRGRVCRYVEHVVDAESLDKTKNQDR